MGTHAMKESPAAAGITTAPHHPMRRSPTGMLVRLPTAAVTPPIQRRADVALLDGGAGATGGSAVVAVDTGVGESIGSVVDAVIGSPSLAGREAGCRER